MDSKNATSPLLLSPRELLLAELNGALSQWQHGRDHSAIGPRVARDLLAHWSGLRRLSGDPVGDERATHLDELVRSSITELGERMMPLGKGFGATWRRGADELSRTWDNASVEDHDDVAWTAQLLFEELDRLQLAVWTLNELLPGDSPLRPALVAIREEAAEAEHFLDDRPELFLDRVDELSEVLSTGRRNLDQEYPELWATLLKYRRIEEEQEAVEARPPLARLLSTAASVRRPSIRPGQECVTDSSQHAASVEFAQAAGPGNVDPLQKLAVADPPAHLSDYRRAWAHFLACCYQRTPPAAAWLKLFLEAIAANGTFSDDWSERARRVQGLLQQPDQMPGGLKAFSLEPRPLHSRDDLLRWLQELLGPDSL